ncbi:MAG: septation protein A [Pseudomonadota bacterium]
MQIFYDLFPLFFFFIAYKFMGIYVATGVAIAASVIQVVYTRIRHKNYQTIQVVTCVMIVVFGGMTLAFHNPVFIKWKPTMINWILAIIFIGSQHIGKQSVLQRMLHDKISAPAYVWRTLNTMWVSFFIFTGTLNLIVAYNVDTDTWVNFKVFGMLGLTFIFGVIQAFYLAKHIKTSGPAVENNHANN